MTTTTLLTQVAILVYLVYELLTKQFAINSAIKLIKDGNDEELA